ncbi:hypothetical protein BU15DRAFT_55975, partial [Melanogaster broomeanus]
IVACQQQHHVHHEAVTVPSHQSPFAEFESQESFWEALREVVINKITPDGFRLMWESGHYPVYETIIYVG